MAWSPEPRGSVVGFVALNLVDVVKQESAAPADGALVNCFPDVGFAGEERGPVASELVPRNIRDLDGRVKPCPQELLGAVLFVRGQDAHQALVGFEQRK